MFELNLDNLRQLLVTVSTVIGAGVPIITALVQVVKMTFGNKLDTRYIPAISLALGTIGGLAAFSFTWPGLIIGFLVGLAATGLWEVGNRTVR